ncbi:MAG: FKBP-type peptidyl-prolyl cis-trans isomerase [Planctomycetota bacterium]
MRTPLLWLAATALAACSDSGTPALGEEEYHFLSKSYDVEGLHRSMMGPRSREYITLLPKEDESELLWVTGFKAVMVDGDGETSAPQDFMCHSNFSLQQPYIRLFTLSQGQLSIRFPEGFAVPVMSDKIMSVETQVLNLNEPDLRRQVRHKIDVSFVRDSEVETPFRPLAVKHGYALVSLGEEPVAWDVSTPDGVQERACCLPGEAASLDSMMTDSQGRRFSGHFVVEPGRHEYRTLITKQMKLEYDTTLHYVAVHVHPFAEYAELYDLTDGRVVYRGYAEQFEGRIGLEHVDYFSSEEGIPLYKDHEYEIVGVYNNTSDEPQDSMIVMLLYVEDQKFVKPVPGASSRPSYSVTPSEDVAPGKIVVDELVEGFGAGPEDGNMVVVHYTGWLADGTRFESSHARGMPFAFPLGIGRVVPGLDQAIAGMRVGGTAKVTVPGDLGFGPKGAGDGTIPPNATLVFEVELLDVPEVGYEIVEEGDGEPARFGQNATLHYRGFLDDGTEFDSSHSRGEPYAFRVGWGRVIAGWHKAVEGMKVGEKRRARIPAVLGYGPLGFGDQVPPNSDLTFELELVGLE